MLKRGIAVAGAASCATEPTYGPAVPTPDGLHADEHPFARDLLRAPRGQGVRLRAVVL